MSGSARAEAFSYSAVKFFLTNSNLCDHGTSVTERPTDRQKYTVALTALCGKQDAMLSQRWPRDAPYSLYGWSENRI